MRTQLRRPRAHSSLAERMTVIKVGQAVRKWFFARKRYSEAPFFYKYLSLLSLSLSLHALLVDAGPLGGLKSDPETAAWSSQGK